MAVAAEANALVFAPTSTSSSLSEPSDSITLLKFVSLGLIIALGSAGNVLVIYAFSRNFRLRTSPYVLMVGFVSLDLIRIFLCFPVVFVTVMHRLEWKYSGALCQWMAFTNVFCMYGNSLTLLAMACDRYVATRYSQFHQRRMIRGFVGTAVLMVVWGMAFLCAFPAVYGLGSYQYRPVEGQCSFPHHYYKSDKDTLCILSTLTGLLFLSQFVYFKLFLFLRSRRRMRPVLYEPAVSEDWSFFGPGATRNIARNQWLVSSLSTSAAPLPTIGRNVLNLIPQQDRMLAVHSSSLEYGSGNPKKDENLNKVCFVVNAVFVSMWAPYIIVCFWQTLRYHGQNNHPVILVPTWVEATSTWLTYFQVALTPIAFFSVAGFARKALLRKTKRRSNTFSTGQNLCS